MTDGLGYTPGNGATVATDATPSGEHVQIVKLAVSADGSATVIPADATYGMVVDVTRVNGTVAVDQQRGGSLICGQITASNPAVQIPADAARRTLLIQNYHGGGGNPADVPVFVSHTQQTANALSSESNIQLNIGESLSLEVSPGAAVWCWSASPKVVSWMAETV